MKRVAIYARFSTNNQTEKSIVDQVAQCEEFCRKKGWPVFRVYSDSGKSGASIHGRPELQALLQAALKQQFDILLTESMSRVARNIRDRADIREMLESSEISLWTPTGGEVNQLVDEVTSVMDSQYRREITKKR